MRVVTLAKNLQVGGTQVSAVDLAIALHSMGHEVVVAAPDGPLSGKLRTSHVKTERLPDPGRPIGRVRAIRTLLATVRPDVIHSYEVRSILDASYASRMLGGPPILGAILSTRVPWYLPESIPLTVGMPNLLEFTRRWRTGSVALMDPPIVPAERGQSAMDLVPELDELGKPRRLVVLVSRLVEPFKREGILRTIESMQLLGQEGFALLIVGDGSARPLYEKAGRATNIRVGRAVVWFAGELLDPTPAFAAADVVIGNGASILRAAAQGTPAVVTGREGYSTVVTTDVLGALSDRGFYGVGEGRRDPDPLADQVRASLSPDRDGELAVIKRLILDRYGVEEVAARLETELIQASRQRPPSWGELMRASTRLAYYRALRARLRSEARGLGLHAEIADNYVYGQLRNMALPPSRFGTGRNRRSF